MTKSSDFSKWDIWIAYVAFEDHPDVLKARPVLVIAEDVFVVLSIKITSHSPREGYVGEYEIVRWKEAGLLKPSTIRFSKRLSLPKSAFIRKLGTLHIDDQMNVEHLL